MGWGLARLMPQEAAAPAVDVLHHPWGEVHHLVAEAGDETLQAEADPHDVAHPIDIIKLQHDGAHQGVYCPDTCRPQVTMAALSLVGSK